MEEVRRGNAAELVCLLRYSPLVLASELTIRVRGVSNN